jgi:tetratricopeptide (TPR) repeat protein
LRDAVLTETAGNPFFVAEILRHLAETGAIYHRNDGRWVTNADIRAVGLPVSVTEVVGRRLACLGPDTERVLGLAAVIGRDFDIPLLASVAQIDEDTLVDLCDAAVAAAVLQTTDHPDRYTFAHALVEHALYDGLSPARRARAHRAVAEQLEPIPGGDPRERAGELARHWAAAVQPADASKAIHYAQLAAARALDQLAPDEARRWYSQALELLDRATEPGPRARAEILLGLGDAQRQCGIPIYRETLLDAAHVADEIDAIDLLARAALANHRGWSSLVGDTDHERLEVIDRALERLDDPHSPERARLLAIACSERTYDSDLDERLALAQEAIATGRRSGDPAALVAALSRTNVAIAAPWTLDVRTEWTTEACQLADTHGDVAACIIAHNNAMSTALERGDLAAMRRHAAVSEEVAERAPHAPQRWNVAFNRVLYAVLRGDLDDAERLAEAAYALGSETGQPDAIAIFGGQLVNIRYHQGRFHEMIPLIEQAIAEPSGPPVYQPALADAYARAGDIERARELLDTQVAAGLAMRADHIWSTAHATWANAAVRVGHHGVAQIVRERIAPFHDQVVTSDITVHPAVAHYLGRLDHLLGRYDEADTYFTEAMAMHERLESPLLIAHTQAAWAALLADRSRRDDDIRARAMAERALSSATAGGYGYIEADALAVLSQLA